MKVAIIGAGLAGLSAAVDLVDAGHSVELFEARPFLGGKVGSWEDQDGNHIEMGPVSYTHLTLPTTPYV